MAGMPGRSGGDRPGAPQNNPMNINPMGGNGQSGMNTDYTGFGYGQNKALNQSRVQGNQAVQSISANMPSSEAMYGGINMPQLGTLLDPTTNPAEPISAGVDFGKGVDSSALPKNFQNNTRPDENAAIMANYLPDLAVAAQSPNAPDSFKRFVNYLAAL
jgi:hypothetical protein